jgi:hypothetical protein
MSNSNEAIIIDTIEELIKELTDTITGGSKVEAAKIYGVIYILTNELKEIAQVHAEGSPDKSCLNNANLYICELLEGCRAIAKLSTSSQLASFAIAGIYKLRSVHCFNITQQNID